MRISFALLFFLLIFEISKGNIRSSKDFDRHVQKENNYCIPTFSYGCYNGEIAIADVELGSIKNNSGNSCSSDAFGDFTSLSTSLEKNGNYLLNLKNNNYALYYSVWADWNDDGDFYDSGENLFLNKYSSSSNALTSVNIHIHDSISLGSHRLRIVGSYYGVSDPCGSSNYGEVEDYTIEVIEPTTMTYMFSTADQVNFDIIEKGSFNNEILKIAITVSGSLSPLKPSFELNTNGTSAGVNISKATLYYSGSNPTFSTADPIGVQTNPSGVFTVSSNVALVNGTNYFWLAFDIPENAPLGGTVDAELISVNVGDSHTPLISSPNGNREINYCRPILNCYGGSYDISSITIGSFVNDTYLDCTDGQVSDFSSLPLSLEQGINVPITISGSSYLYYNIWADFNDDGDFKDSGETLLSDHYTTQETFSKVLSIPLNAPLGYHKLRITVSDNIFQGDPCKNNADKGEVEEYSLQIIQGSPMIFSSAKAYQTDTNNVEKGSVNNLILKVEVNTKGSTSPLEPTFTFSTSGSTNASNDIVKASLFYSGADENFSNAIVVGSVDNPNGSFVITSSDKIINGKSFFWLTYDISSSAAISNIVDAEIVKINTGEDYIPDSTSPVGNRKIEYCIPSSTYGCYSGNMAIGNILLNTLANLTEKSCNNQSYFYFPHLSTALEKGASYDITLTNSYYPLKYNVWIDFNNNGSFNDPNERLVNNFSIGSYSGTGNTTLSIPAEVDTGTYRMRIIGTYNTGTANSCDFFNYGETEDYTIQIVEPTPMTFVSAKAFQENKNIITKTTTNNEILGIKVIASGTSSPIIPTFTFTTLGSTNAGKDISKATLFYTSGKNSFSTATAVGSYNGPEGSFSIKSSLPFLSGVNYFWLTYDIPSTADIGDTIDAVCLQIAANGNFTPDSANPEGSRVIEYCRPLISSPCNNGYSTIAEVKIGAIDNVSNNFCSSDGYNNYTHLSTDLEQASNSNTITFKNGNDRLYYDVFIDINNDGDFFDANEQLINNFYVSTSGGTGNTLLSVPSGASLGKHRLRVKGTYYSDHNNACSDFSLGEIEDYTVNITAASSMKYVSSTSSQSILPPVQKSSINNEILKIEVVTSGAGSPIKPVFTFNTDGSTNPSSDIAKATLYFTGNSNAFSTAKAVGMVSSPNGTFTIASSDSLLDGNNYFWLTYDLTNGATLGNILDARFESLEAEGTHTPTITSPNGNRQLEYCRPTFTYGCYNGNMTISNVNLGAISNNTGKECNATAYNNYTGNIATLEKGAFQNLVLTNGYYPLYYSLFIDFNKDWDFNDAGERVINNFYISKYSGTDSTSLKIPLTVDTGSYRMRIIGGYQTIGTNLCSNYNYGEVEDYTIKVISATPMTYVSSTTFHNTLSVVEKGSMNNEVLGIQINTTGSDSAFAPVFNFTTNGSTNAGGDITKAKLYYTGNTNSFLATDLVGSIESPNGAFSITSSKELSNGKNFFWLTYDISTLATLENVVDAELLSMNANGEKTPAITSPAGNRMIEYCRPIITTACSNGNYVIGKVELNTLNNTSGSQCADQGYSNFISLSTDLEKGSAYVITFKNNAYQLYYSVWIDINNDGDFLDASERLISNFYNSNYGGSSTSVVSIPSNITLGTHRLRVIGSYYNYTTNPCGNISYGEIEDYTVNIVSPLPMVYQSSIASHVNQSGVQKKTTNNEILSVKINVSGSASPLKPSFVFNTKGTTNPSENISKATLYYTGLSEVFSSSNPVGSHSAPNGSFTIASNQFLKNGPNHFWLTYDVPSIANIGDTLDAEIGSVDVGGVRIPDIISPNGSRVIDYCLPVITYGCYSGNMSISEVKIDTLANVTGNSCNSNAYGKFIEKVVELEQGSNVSITFKNQYYPLYYSVYIDFNDDGDFNGIGERVISNFHIANYSSSGTTTLPIPADAILGLHRLRVRGSYNNESGNVCNTISYGEIEDYTVKIVDKTPMFFVSSTSFHKDTSNVVKNSLNNPILGIHIVTTGYSSPISPVFNFSTDGSGNPAKNIKKATLYYSGYNDNFSTATSVGTYATPNGAFSIISNIKLNNGNNYFWLTYDIAPDANLKDTLDAQVLTINVGENKVPDVISPNGYRVINYCQPSITYGCYNGNIAIAKIELNSIQNTTGKSCHANSYNDFTHLSTKLEQGSTHEITFTNSNYGQYYNVWIDFNDDGDFSDNGERVVTNFYIGASGASGSASISVGDSSPLGKRRLRVISSYYNTLSDPCSSFYYGEIEDYTVEIVPFKPMIFVSATTFQSNFNNLQKGSLGNEIIGVKVVTSGSSSPFVPSITFNTKGSTNPATDITKATLFYTGASKSFAKNNLVGTYNSPNGSFIITSSKAMISVDTHYYWLAYDVSPAAGNNHYLDAECSSVNIGTIHSPILKDPSGFRFICPVPKITANGAINICEGNNVTLTSDITKNILWSTNLEGNSIVVKSSGEYYAIYKDEGGCNTTSNKIMVTVEAAPKIVLSKPSTVCKGDSIELSVVNSVSQNWSTGVSSVSIKVSPTDTTKYFVSALTPLGCSIVDSVTINIISPVVPGKVGNMLPTEGTTNLSVPITFSWTPASNASNYDFYLWLDSLPRPSSPIAKNISQINYTYNSSLNFGTLYKWQVDAKNSCYTSNSSVQTFKLRHLPDIIVNSMQVPTSSFSGQEISISYEVKNIGQGGTGSNQWYDAFYLSSDSTLEANVDTYLGAVGNVSSLLSGNGYSNTASFTLPKGISGNYYIIVWADKFNHVLEENQNNNIRNNTPAILINLTPPPDLQVTSIVPPNNIFSEQTVTINWKVTNAGPGKSVSGAWVDKIYLSKDTLWGLSKPFELGTIAHKGVLDPDSSYSASASVTIPQGIFGTYYFYISTDFNNQVYEHVFETNNITQSTPVEIILTPPADMVVTIIDAPMSANNKQAVVVKWTIENQGGSPVKNAWVDRIYLCNSSVFDLSSAIPLGVLASNATINPGESYTASLNPIIPPNIGGTYYFFVQTDYNNHVFEYTNEGNNIQGNDSSTTILNADLIVSKVVGPKEDTSGTSIAVSYYLKNVGQGRVYSTNITDRIMISAFPVFHSDSAIEVKKHSQNISLNQGDSVLINTTAVLPNGISGNYYLFVHSDFSNNVFEKDNEDNNISPSSKEVLVMLAPWPDLIPIGAQMADSIMAGNVLNINYTVSNIGQIKLTGSWKDKIFLSAKSTWDPGKANLIKQVNQTRTLPKDSSYSQNIEVNIANTVAEGKYYVYFMADAENVVYEHSDENNNIQLLDSIEILKYPPVDLIVYSVEGPVTASSGDGIDIEYTIKNIGKSSTLAGFWMDGAFLSEDDKWDKNDKKLKEWKQFGPIQSGANYTSKQSLVLPNGISGVNYIIVVTDVNNINKDEDISNNYKAIMDENGAIVPIQVSLTPPPDLIIENFATTSNGTAGQPISIKWTVKNSGMGNAAGPWTEKFYLSNNLTLDAYDHPLGAFVKSGSLSTSQQYIDSIQVNLPNWGNGNYFILMKTDNNDVVYEHNQESNNIANSVITIVRPPLSDIKVSEVILPSSANAGKSVEVKWKVKNIGQNPAVGQIKEVVYFSTDTLYDINDILLGTVSSNINLPPLSESSHQLIADLTGVSVKDYYVLVTTDALNNILETNDSNNTSSSLSKIQVTVPALAINSTVADQLLKGKNLYYKIEVTDEFEGETLLISLKGDSVNGTNELYIRYGESPTRATFDFGYSSPFQGNQEIIIPSLKKGVYYVLVYGSTPLANSQNISLGARKLNFEIRSVNSNSGGNTGLITIEVKGSKLDKIMGLSLSSSTGDISADSIIIVDPVKIFARFNLAGKTIGTYHVIAKNDKEEEAILNNGFKVVAGKGHKLVTNVIQPPNTRPSNVVSMTVQYSNGGNTDIEAPILLLRSAAGAPIAFSVSDLSKNQTELELPLSEINGPKGVLRPGVIGSIVIYTKATQALSFLLSLPNLE